MSSTPSSNIFIVIWIKNVNVLVLPLSLQVRIHSADEVFNEPPTQCQHDSAEMYAIIQTCNGTLFEWCD